MKNDLYQKALALLPKMKRAIKYGKNERSGRVYWHELEALIVFLEASRDCVMVPRKLDRAQHIISAMAWAKHGQACDGGYSLVGRSQAEAAFYAMIEAAEKEST